MSTRKLNNCKCKTCGLGFYKPPCRLRVGRGKYCSRICSDIGREGVHINVEEKNPNWKGGISKAYKAKMRRKKRGY